MSAPEPAYYPTIVISDAHLGIPSTRHSAHLLAEFLRNTRCDTLVLNGDIIDGTRRDEHHIHSFSESHKQVLDLINQKIAAGTKVYYLPGNHDTALRDIGLFGKTVMGMEFEPWLEMTGPDGKRTLIAHGDSYRGETKPPRAHKRHPLSYVLQDRVYMVAATISGAFDRAASKLLHRHIGLAARLHGLQTRHSDRGEAWAEQALERARTGGYDSIIYGHFHATYAATSPTGRRYINGGDWVENFTAVAMDTDGGWSLLKWPDLRKNMRAAGTFNAKADKKAARAARPQTEKMVAAVQKIWPGS